MSDVSELKRKADYVNLIKALAAETHHSVEEVDRVYAEAYESLNSDARVKDFLDLLTYKKVRDQLH